MKKGRKKTAIFFYKRRGLDRSAFWGELERIQRILKKKKREGGVLGVQKSNQREKGSGGGGWGGITTESGS